MNLTAPVISTGADGKPTKVDIAFRVKFVHSPFVQKANAPQGTPGGSRSTTCTIAVVSPDSVNEYSEKFEAEGKAPVFLTPLVQAESICKGRDVNLFSAAYGRKNSLEKALRVLVDREKYTTEHAFVLEGLEGCPFKFTDETVKAFIKALRERYPRGWDVAAGLSKIAPTVYPFQG